MSGKILGTIHTASQRWRSTNQHMGQKRSRPLLVSQRDTGPSTIYIRQDERFCMGICKRSNYPALPAAGFYWLLTLNVHAHKCNGVTVTLFPWKLRLWLEGLTRLHSGGRRRRCWACLGRRINGKRSGHDSAYVQPDSKCCLQRRSRRVRVRNDKNDQRQRIQVCRKNRGSYSPEFAAVVFSLTFAVTCASWWARSGR